MNNQITVTNLNELYENIKEINELSKESNEMHLILDRTILKLSYYWTGSDATFHYTRLLTVSDSLLSISKSTWLISDYADKSLHIMLDKQRANGGNPPDFSRLPILKEDLYSSTLDHEEFIKTMEAKGQGMEVHPVEMKEIFSYLVGMQDQFNHFADKFLKLSSYMLDIWQSGKGRDTIIENITIFKNNIEAFKQAFVDTTDFLEMVFRNYLD